MTTKHRVKSGALAGAGTFACMMVATYQRAHEQDKKVDVKKTLKLSGGLGIAAGVLWALTPSSASSDHAEVVEATKERTYPSLRLLIRRMSVGELLEVRTPASTPVSTYGVNHNRPQPPSIYSSRRSTVDDFGDDPVSDEEYAELLDEELRRQDKLDDPFYEGPSSIFDKV